MKKPKFNKMIFNPEENTYIQMVVLDNTVYFEGFIEDEDKLRTQKFVLSNEAFTNLAKMINEFMVQAEIEEGM